MATNLYSLKINFQISNIHVVYTHTHKHIPFTHKHLYMYVYLHILIILYIIGNTGMKMLF